MVYAISPALTNCCVERMETEQVTSTVEYVSDVLFHLCTQLPRETSAALADKCQRQPDLAALFTNIGNKRKFRNAAKHINLTARKRLK